MSTNETRELRCPHCGQSFIPNDVQYESMLAQVRGKEFDKAVERELEARTAAMQAKSDLAVGKAAADARAEAESERRLLSDQLADAKAEIDRLKGQVGLAGERQQLAVAKAVAEERDRSAGEMRELTTQLEYYRDLKTRMSTKMVGETLEQHCLTEFNRIRSAAFPTAYFEKDNVVSQSGSKGDFIFRETSEDGLELISIMFEMKNEMDTTASKHRNEDFLKELDKDRREKGCEYAVLVSMLEADSDYYNDGIVDMSYRYPKMYVIRPQFFIPLISILRNAAMNAMSARRELDRVRKANLDVTRFEENVTAFKESISRNYDLASRQFAAAIDEIDKSISHLQKVRDSLTKSEHNLKILNDKTDRLSVKDLTKGAPSVRLAIEAGSAGVQADGNGIPS